MTVNDIFVLKEVLNVTGCRVSLGYVDCRLDHLHCARFAGFYVGCCSIDGHQVDFYAVCCASLFLCFRGTYCLHFQGDWIWFRVLLTKCICVRAVCYVKCWNTMLYKNPTDAHCLITFPSSEFVLSVSLSQIMMFGLLLGTFLSVLSCWFHNMATLPLWLIFTDLVCAYSSVPCLILRLFPCIC